MIGGDQDNVFVKKGKFWQCKPFHQISSMFVVKSLQTITFTNKILVFWELWNYFVLSFFEPKHLFIWLRVQKFNHNVTAATLSFRCKKTTHFLILCSITLCNVIICFHITLKMQFLCVDIFCEFSSINLVLFLIVFLYTAQKAETNRLKILFKIGQ